MDKMFLEVSELLLLLKVDFTSCLTSCRTIWDLEMITIAQSASQKPNFEKWAKKLLKISCKAFQIILVCKQTVKKISNKCMKYALIQWYTKKYKHSRSWYVDFFYVRWINYRYDILLKNEAKEKHRYLRRY